LQKALDVEMFEPAVSGFKTGQPGILDAAIGKCNLVPQPGAAAFYGIIRRCDSAAHGLA
jgi:hypothetical protein